MVYLSIVIPCHNEEASLPILCKELEKVLSCSLKNDKHGWEVLLVDDVSTDKTYEIMQSFQKKNPRFKPIHLEKRGGQTGAYRAAFAAAKGEYILRMDGDLQDDPQELPLFLEKMKKGYDLVVGIREARKHRTLLRFASQVFDAFAILVFDSPFHAASSSYVAFRAKYLKNLKLYKNDHRYLVCIALSRGVDKPGEVVTRHRARYGGKSKYGVFKKLFFGFPEFLLFILRAKFGCYKYPKQLNQEETMHQTTQTE